MLDLDSFFGLVLTSGTDLEHGALLAPEADGSLAAVLAEHDLHGVLEDHDPRSI